jgi:hypothetical protein
MSTLGDIRSPSAKNNVANSFHVYSLDAANLIFDDIVLPDLPIDSALYVGSTNILSAAGPMTNGQVLIGSTGLSPTNAALTAGQNIAITNGAGSISVGLNIPSPILTLPYVNSTHGLSSYAQLTNGQILIGNLGNVPSVSTITAGQNIAITNGAGSITAAVNVPTVANSLPYVNASNGLTSYAQPTNGQIIIGSTGALPVVSTLTAGTGISITNGAGSITISGTGDTAISSYTPILSFGGASTGITYNTQIGQYQTKGNTCFFNIQIALSSKGSSSGAAAISLPTAVNSSVATSAFSIPYYNAIATTASSITGVAQASQTVFTLNSITAGLVASITDSGFTNSSLLVVSGFYYV